MHVVTAPDPLVMIADNKIAGHQKKIAAIFITSYYSATALTKLAFFPFDTYQVMSLL